MLDGAQRLCEGRTSTLIFQAPTQAKDEAAGGWCAASPSSSTWQEMNIDKAGRFIRSQMEAAAEPGKGLLL